MGGGTRGRWQGTGEGQPGVTPLRLTEQEKETSPCARRVPAERLLSSPAQRGGRRGLSRVPRDARLC